MDLTQLSSQLKLKTDFNADKSFGLRNINSITGIIDNSVSSLQALIFTNDNPEYDDFDPTNYDITGITSGYDKKAFIFDLKKDYKLSLSSEITDHYVEDNLAIQDQIGLRPIILEVTGSIAEVDLKTRAGKGKNEDNTYNEINKNGNAFNAIDSYLGRMGSLTSFAPNLVNQALDIYNSAKSLYAMTNKVVNLSKKDKTQDLKEKYKDSEKYNLDIIKQTKQFEWVNWFRTQWWNRASFSIVTPYGVLSNMYIMDLSATQPENTRYVTNLNIKFKQIRKAITIKSGRRSKAQDNEIQTDKNTPIIDLENINVGDGTYIPSGIDMGIKKYSTTAIPEIEEVKYKKSLNVGGKKGSVSSDAFDTIMKLNNLDPRTTRQILSEV